MAALLVVVLALAGLPGARAYEVMTVEVWEGGFNPTVCQMNREFLRFKNVGNNERRVVRISPTPGGDLLFDSGWLAPGAVSKEDYLGFPGTFRYEDFENPEHFVIVKTPVRSPQWTVVCSPDPERRPPPPLCRGQEHCLRVPSVAMD
jgi:hypothetical protein